MPLESVRREGPPAGSRAARLLLAVLLFGSVLLVADPAGARGGRRGFPPDLFRQLDTDEDGSLSPQELGRRRGRMFRRIDANGDGKVSLAEARAHFKGKPLPRGLAKLYVAPLAPVEEIAGRRLAKGPTWNNRPSAATTADGTTWVAFVRHHQGEGDEVAVLPVKADGTAEPTVLTPIRGQYVRPVLAAAGGDLWCAWTASEPDRVSAVWWSRTEDGAWTRPRRLDEDETRPLLNPELAAGADGRVAAVYQVHTGPGYDIHLRLFDGESWGPAQAIGEGSDNHWDPVAAFDIHGVLHVLWSGFADGDYDIYHRRVPGEAPARRISRNGEYDLHPWIAASPSGPVYASWDVVRISKHAGSGRTTITGANLKEAEPGKGGARSWVEVKVIDGDVLRIPGKPREEIVPPKGYQLAHNGLAKVAIGPKGEPWVFYRVLRKNTNPWLPEGGIGYYWDLLARPFTNGAWGEPKRLRGSDGYLEEAALAPGPDGIRVAYGGERRHESLERARREPDHDPLDHHHDYDGVPGCNGDIYLAVVGDPGAPGPKEAFPKEAAKPDEEEVLAERTRIEPYVVEVEGQRYRLLFGDTHRHSNVSRCSAGSEPSPDDLYRYGTDVCRYDFLALSDHAEHLRLTDRDAGYIYWWLQQKLADLYHVPGHLSVLYNFEWSLRFPHGHHNTLFPGRPTVILARDLAESDTLAEGWKVLEKAGLRAITIPHTGADPRMGTDWSVQDDRYQRLCEIFQACRGSYEHEGCPREFTQTSNKKGFYWRALEKGYHVGVIASTDHGYGASYACVYAAGENTREAVWQAMWDRRTYGSTTYGLILDVRSGNRWMGEEWESHKAPPLQITVRTRAPIRSVEILGRSSVLWAAGSVEAPLGVKEYATTWTDREWDEQTKEQWYYVRVIQTDDEMAWSSPVWVKPVR